MAETCKCMHDVINIDRYQKWYQQKIIFISNRTVIYFYSLYAHCTTFLNQKTMLKKLRAMTHEGCVYIHYQDDSCFITILV